MKNPSINPDKILDGLKTLTPREHEVLNQVVSGRLNKQIAGELGITERTVKEHRKRVMEKMEADSLAELVTMIVTTRLGKS
jgi:FixJ family two-component response regulator